MSSATGTGRIHNKHDGGDDKGKHVEQVTPDKRPSTAETINIDDAESLGNQRNDRVDGLILEGISGIDTSLSINSNRVVLNRRNTSHLNRSLKTARDQETTEARNIPEELKIRLGAVGMLVGNAFLNLLDLRADPGIIDVAVGVEAGKGLECFILLTLVHEPAGRLWEHEDEGAEDDGRDDLDAEGDSPLSVVGVVGECAPAGPRCDEGSDSQHELLESCDSASDGRMCDLGLVQRNDHGQETDTKTGKEATSHKV